MAADLGADPDELLRERGVEVDWAAAQERVGGYQPELYALVLRQLPDADAVLAAEASGRTGEVRRLLRALGVRSGMPT